MGSVCLDPTETIGLMNNLKGIGSNQSLVKNQPESDNSNKWSRSESESEPQDNLNFEVVYRHKSYSGHHFKFKLDSDKHGNRFFAANRDQAADKCRIIYIQIASENWDAIYEFNSIRPRIIEEDGRSKLNFVCFPQCSHIWGGEGPEEDISDYGYYEIPFDFTLYQKNLLYPKFIDCQRDAGEFVWRYFDPTYPDLPEEYVYRLQILHNQIIKYPKLRYNFSIKSIKKFNNI